jgi:hypothetical protein
MKTIAQIINSARVGTKLTDGKRQWKVIRYGDNKIAVPVENSKDPFEMWAGCGLERLAFLPGLKVVK